LDRAKQAVWGFLLSTPYSSRAFGEDYFSVIKTSARKAGNCTICVPSQARHAPSPAAPAGYTTSDFSYENFNLVPRVQDALLAERLAGDASLSLHNFNKTNAIIDAEFRPRVETLRLGLSCRGNREGRQY
jgi:hypothetical protein